MWKIGDIVARKSYGGDIVFRIERLDSRLAVLRGIEYRLLADAELTDLVRVEQPESHRGTAEARDKIAESVKKLGIYRELQKEKEASAAVKQAPPYFELPGKILHLDGDASYLQKSMRIYRELGIPAEGCHVHESMMAEAARRLLPAVRPDILVVTGHDGLIKNSRIADRQHIGNYKNSFHFVNAVQAARQYERSRDALTIVAGACQSHFEALLQAGANFASSPGRILIHALDPVHIAAKAAFTSIRDTINIYDVIRHTMSGLEGVGGIESRGSYRKGLPKLEM